MVAVLLLLRRDLLLFCLIHRPSIGINTGVLHYVLLSVLSLAAVAGLQSVGIILVVAMLVTPGATAYLLTDRFDRMTLLAITSSVLASLLGVIISYWSDSSTAAASCWCKPVCSCWLSSLLRATASFANTLKSAPDVGSARTGVGR